MSWTVTVAMSPTTISFSSSTSPQLDWQSFHQCLILEGNYETGNEFFLQNIMKDQQCASDESKFKTLIQCETPLEIDQTNCAMRAYREVHMDSDYLRLILIYLGRSWYSVNFTGAKYSWLTYGFSRVLLEALGHSSVPQANVSGLCNSLTLHVAAMTGKCLSRLLQLELKHHIGDGNIRKKFWGTPKHPNPGRLGNSLTLDLRCICDMCQEKLLLAGHFATQLGNFCTSTSAIWSAVIEDRPCHSKIWLKIFDTSQLATNLTILCPSTKLIGVIQKKKCDFLGWDPCRGSTIHINSAEFFPKLPAFLCSLSFCKYSARVDVLVAAKPWNHAVRPRQGGRVR